MCMQRNDACPQLGMWFHADPKQPRNKRCNSSELEPSNDIQPGKPSPPPSDFAFFRQHSHSLTVLPNQPNKTEKNAMCVGTKVHNYGVR